MGISVSVVKTEPVGVSSKVVKEFVESLAMMIDTQLDNFQKEDLLLDAKRYGQDAVDWVNALPFEEDVITLQFWY